MNILMLSSSKEFDEAYLSHAYPYINSIIEANAQVIFVPYAAVSVSYDEYTSNVQKALNHLHIIGLHNCEEPALALLKADAIIVGGGNTFALLNQLYSTNTIAVIRQAVSNGVTYIGWSAGSNICGLTIKTTNDMPIVEPASFDALGFLPFQLNPHYTDFVPPGHNGETRDQRLQEFCALNKTTPVLGLKEGGALHLKDGTLTLLGAHNAYLFLNQTKKEINPPSNLSYLLQ